MKRLLSISLILFAFSSLCVADGESSKATSDNVEIQKADMVAAISTLYELAKENSYTYQKADSSLKDAQTDIAIKNCDLAPKIKLPQASGELSWETAHELNPRERIDYTDSYGQQFTVSGEAKQPIIDVEKCNETKAAKAVYQTTRISRELSGKDILFVLLDHIIKLNSYYWDLKFAYTNLNNSLNDVKIDPNIKLDIVVFSNDEIDKIYEIALEKISKISEAGDIYNINNIQIADDLQKLMVARENVENEKIKLLRFLGLSPTEELAKNLGLSPNKELSQTLLLSLEDPPAFDEPMADYSFDQVNKNNTSLQEAKSKLIEAEAQRSIVNSQWFPTVSASFGYGLYKTTIPVIYPIKQLDSASAGLDFCWELDTLWTTPLKLAKSNRQVDLAKKNIQKINDDLKAEIEELLASFKSNSAQWGALDSSKHLAILYLNNRFENYNIKKNTAESTKKKEELVSAFSVLEQARTKYFDTMQNMIGAKVKLLSIWAQLLRARGDLTVGNFYRLIPD